MTKAGLEDVVAANSAICDIIGPEGKLTYRGIDIHDLARQSSFEETTFTSPSLVSSGRPFIGM